MSMDLKADVMDAVREGTEPIFNPMRTKVFKTFQCECCNNIKNIDEREKLPMDYFGREPFVCKDCAQTIKNQTPEKPRTDAVDIHKIIDDAMEKGDRSVSIMMHNDITSVEVRPYEEEKVQWLYDENKDHAWCSNCGYEDRGWNLSAYCPQCGELMHGDRKVEKDDKV